MSEALESKIIQKFRQHLDRESLTEDIKVVYRVAGGMPHERIEEEFRLSGKGTTEVMMRDELKAIPAQEASGELDQAETRDLLQQIEAGLDSLVPRSEARFIPDSVVASITVEVDGEEVTLYFLPEEEQRLAQEKPIAPQMTGAVQRIRQISQRLLESKKEQGHE
jgi:hypothetical protein